MVVADSKQRTHRTEVPLAKLPSKRTRGKSESIFPELIE